MFTPLNPPPLFPLVCLAVMILLEPGNRILGEVVSNVIMPAGEEKRDALDVRLCDFDDVTYRVQVEKGGNSIKVSMSCPCYHQIEEHGAKASFEKAFGAHSVEPESPYHLAVSIDFTALKDEAEKSEPLYLPTLSSPCFRSRLS